MRLRLTVIVLFLCFGAATQVNAQTTAGEVDCGEWLQAKTEARKKWLLGYLSGLNIQYVFINNPKGDTPGPLSKISSANQAYVWMDKYCRANPLRSLGNGGFELFQELNGK